MWKVENYADYQNILFAHMVYAVVDKVSYQNGYNPLMKQVASIPIATVPFWARFGGALRSDALCRQCYILQVPERCDAIEDEIVESTSADVAHRS